MVRRAGRPAGGVGLADDGVFLKWENGSDYDSILIRRNGDKVAELPGFMQRWVDWRAVDPGEYHYQVYGIRGNEITKPAECRVVIPPGIPGPEGLTCEVLEPDDTLDAGFAVLLKWVNPVRYDSMVLTRNGQPLAAIQHQGRLLNTWSEIVYDGRGYRLSHVKGQPCSCVLADAVDDGLLFVEGDTDLQVELRRAVPLPLLVMAAVRIVDETASITAAAEAVEAST